MSNPTACATIQTNKTIDATKYTYTGDTPHNVQLHRLLCVPDADTFEQFLDKGLGNSAFASPDLSDPNYPGGIIVVTSNYTLTQAVLLQTNQKLIINNNAKLIIGPSGNLIMGGALDVSGGEIDVSGGSVTSIECSGGVKNFMISSWDFFQLFYNHTWRLKSLSNTKKKFRFPCFYGSTWTPGRDISMNDLEVRSFMNLYNWFIGEGSDERFFNLANFAINQWLIDLSNNITSKTKVNNICVEENNNCKTTITIDGSTNNISSTNTGLRNELLINSYLYNIPIEPQGALTWGHLLKTLDESSGGALTTRFDLANSPREALQTGDVIILVVAVRNDNPFAENIFIRLPFQIK